MGDVGTFVVSDPKLAQSIKDAIKQLYHLVNVQNRGKECLESLRSVFSIYMMPPMNERNQQQNDANGAAQGHTIAIPPQFIQLLSMAVQDKQMPLKMLSLFAFLLQNSHTSEPDILKDLVFKKEENDMKLNRVLFGLLVCIGSDQSLALNLNSFVQFFPNPTPELRPSVFRGLLRLAQSHRGQLIGHVKTIETQMAHFLLHASQSTDQPKQSGISLMGFTNFRGTADPVSEIDGSPSRDFFTVLNIAQNYSEEQQLNILTFSSLYEWIHWIYFAGKEVARERDPRERELLLGQQYQSQSQQSSMTSGSISLIGSVSLSASFEEVVVTYCLRILEQSKLKIEGQQQIKEISEQALVEAIRILHLLCSLDHNLVARVYGVMKKITARGKLGIGVWVSLLRFFLDHSNSLPEENRSDIDSQFRLFFEDHFAKNCTKALTAMETLRFLIENKERLLANTTVFSTYFPPLMKLIAWFPVSYPQEFLELMGAMVDGRNCVELFHSILDLPLLVIGMERLYGHEEDGEEVRYRAIYNYLLRNESGVSINFWDSSTTLPLLRQFCNESVKSKRVFEVCRLVPQLLEIYFDVIVNYGTQQVARDLVPVIFQRLDQLFPLESYVISVRELLESKILSIFHRWPSFIVDHKDLITDVIADNSPARKELVLSICWLIGEYTSNSITSDVLVPNEIMSEYHEALDVFTYEQMSLSRSKHELSQQQQQQQQAQQYQPPPQPQSQLSLLAQSPLLTQLPLLTRPSTPTNTNNNANYNNSNNNNNSNNSNNSNESPKSSNYETRVMLVLISSLAKLGARWPPLIPRVVLCLSKASRHQFFHESVIRRANECLNLLKFPSIAAAILDAPRKTGKKVSHIDDNTSLPFILLGSNPNENAQPLHSFLPA